MEHHPAYHVQHPAAIHAKTGVAAPPSEPPPHGGGSMARDRVTGGVSSTFHGADTRGTGTHGKHEEFRLSDEWDEEMDSPDVGTTDADREASKADEQARAAQEKAEQEKAEQQRQQLDDELKQVDQEIRETETALADARRSGDDDTVKELEQQLGDLKVQRDEIQQTLQQLAPPSGTAPRPAPAGGSALPASEEFPPAATAPVSGASPSSGTAAPVSYPSRGGYPSSGSTPPGGGYAPATVPASGDQATSSVGSVGGATPSSSTSSSRGSGAASPVAADPSVGSAPATPRAPGEGLIRPGMKVLQIGDSHTIGPFGTELDKQLRSTGAKVETYGSSGSSPSYWLNGTTTHSGYVARHANGSVDQPPWNQAHATPRLSDLVASERPDVVVVNLGANMRGMSPKQINEEVGRLATVARSTGARLIWVGPPRTRDDMSNPASIKSFDAAMSKAVAPYGTYLDSAQYTSYSGSDGIHYGGTEGTRTARNWADRIFSDIQSAP